MRSKTKVTINLTPEVARKAKELGVNISALAEEAVRRQIRIIESQKQIDISEKVKGIP